MLLPIAKLAATSVAALLPINLAAVDAAYLIRILLPPAAHLLVYSGTLSCQRTQGVCFPVSQLLLVLRQGGAKVWLRNASPVPWRCLKQLRLNSFFTLAD